MQRIISASVELRLDTTQVNQGEQLTVRAFIQDQSIGCTFIPQLLRLDQQGSGSPLFIYESPQTVSPPISPTLFLLRATKMGTVVLKASAYGDVHCDSTTGWWINGNSQPINVQGGRYKIYLPTIFKH